MKKFNDDVKIEVNVVKIVIGIIITSFITAVILLISNANVVNLI